MRRIGPEHFGVRSNVVSAQLAVRSDRTGTPVAYAELDAQGRTKLWAVGSCR